MPQTVLITGTGRPYALGFNLVKRYLENGDCVFASIRRPSEALDALKKEYPDRLHILTMDISSTESVNAAAREAENLVLIETNQYPKPLSLKTTFKLTLPSKHFSNPHKKIINKPTLLLQKPMPP